MKITKKGTLPSERIWVGRCSNCRTEAEAIESELSPKHDQREGSYAQHPCPLCGEEMNFWPKQRNLHG